MIRSSARRRPQRRTTRHASPYAQDSDRDQARRQATAPPSTADHGARTRVTEIHTVTSDRTPERLICAPSATQRSASQWRVNGDPGVILAQEGPPAQATSSDQELAARKFAASQSSRGPAVALHARVRAGTGPGLLARPGGGRTIRAYSGWRPGWPRERLTIRTVIGGGRYG